MTISVVCLFDSNSSIIANQSCNIYAHHSTSFCTTQMWPDWFKLNGKNTENYMASIWQWTSHGRVSVHLPNRYSFPYGTMRLDQIEVLEICQPCLIRSAWQRPEYIWNAMITQAGIIHGPCIANWIQLAQESYERCSKFSCGFHTIIQALRQSLRFAYVSQVLAYDRYVSMIWAYGDLTAKEGCKLDDLDFFEFPLNLMWLYDLVVVTFPF